MVPVIQQMLPKMDSILISLNKLLADPALAATLHNTQVITENLTVTTNQINQLMKNDIPQLTGKLNHISDNFVTISDNLAQTDYNAMLQRVDATLASFASITDKLNNKDNNLGLLLNDSTLYYNLNRTSSNAADLLEDLKTHPKRYVHFSLFGRKDDSK